jgi:predicted dehydrogenase
MIKFGVIGAGNITKSFCEAIKKTSGVLYGIASRSLEKAIEYQNIYGFEVAYGDYEALVKDSNVDVVYIATPHSHHYEHMMMALKHKKHVLCEKAFTLNEQQAIEVIEYAKKQQCFLMEAMWTRFLPVIREVQNQIDAGMIGKIKHVEAQFGFIAHKNDDGRLFNPHLGGGALLDIGIYPLTIYDLFVGYPDQVFVNGNLYHTGVDVRLDIKMVKDDVSGHLKASFEENHGIHATIYGEKGYVKIPHFIGANQAFFYHNNDVLLHDIHIPHLANGMEYEIIEVINMIENNQLESPMMPHHITIRMMKLMDMIRSEIK